MRYFRNTELAKLYDISEKTVRNWIKQAQTGALSLDIYTDEKGRSYIADTTKNALAIKGQIEENKKYRNSRTHKVVTPKQEFYAIYSWPQIYDIVSHLEKFNDFPFHYAHMGDGAEICTQYFMRLHNEKIRNSQSFSDNFFKYNEYSILQLFQTKLNLIELGGRSGLTTRYFIDRLIDLGRINSYVDIDFSSEMIDRNQQNITQWFAGRLKFSAAQKDIIRERFDDVILESSIGGVPNLITLLGGTMHAFNDPRSALRNIRESIGSGDYFLFSSKIDSETARRYFDFNPTFENDLLPQKELFLIDLLNIEPSFYTVEQFYDEVQRQRVIQVRLKFDVTVNFQLKNGIKSLDFKKGETIMLWRFWHQTMEEMIQEFTDCGFNVVQAVKSPDEQYAMIIAKVRTDKVNHR